MMGTKQEPGIVPLIIREIFEQIEALEEKEFLIRIGYTEIYNEKIFDLLDKNRPEIVKMYESTSGETNIKQCEVIVSSEEEILRHYEVGNSVKQMGETSMNDRSSRSHTIFRITIESQQRNADEDSGVQISNLNLVDLAGSERADQTKATGNRLKEGSHINKSLLSLSKVIRELSEVGENGGEGFINYRDSKLTRILSASLGGNATTSIICTVTPAAIEETYYTLT
jgi:centromeric protein E